MPAVEHLYRYPRASSLTDNGDGPQLSLSTSTSTTADDSPPCFFRGQLRGDPRPSAQCLRSIGEIALTRYFTPPAMLERILLEADPVVTASRQSLRFEAFSACCSAYARLDLDPEALDVERISPGTTNVDFHAPMRAALAKVRATTPMSLRVGHDSVALETDIDAVVEKQVPLPLRWIKGMGEVQAQLARMQARLTVPRAETIRFLRQLPNRNTRHTAWVIASGRGVRLTQREAPGGVRVSGIERLRALADLAVHAREMRVYAEDASGSSAWVLHLEHQRFVFVMSPTRWRGFSGEGQLLVNMSRDDSSAALAHVRSALNWNDHLDVDRLAEEFGLESDRVRQALAILAAQGLVGYDLHTAGYFHRVLPFDRSGLQALHPRLTAAHNICAAGGLTATPEGDAIVVMVPSADVQHRVLVSRTGATCTCPWYAKHRGDRGPCKHVLAAQMFIEGPTP